MILLTEAGKAHVVKQLNIKVEANQYVTEEELPQHKLNVYTSWYKHCETKLNRNTKVKTIPVGIGWLTFEEHMLQDTAKQKSA